MTKLIDAEALKEAMKKAKRGHYSAFSDNTLQSINKTIDNAPTVEPNAPKAIAKVDKNGEIDIIPLRPRGEWIITDCERDILHANGKKYTCSVCGVDNCYGKPPFCMWCGSDMRGDANDG